MTVLFAPVHAARHLSKRGGNTVVMHDCLSYTSKGARRAMGGPNGPEWPFWFKKGWRIRKVTVDIIDDRSLPNAK